MRHCTESLKPSNPSAIKSLCFTAVFWHCLCAALRCVRDSRSDARARERHQMLPSRPRSGSWGGGTRSSPVSTPRSRHERSKSVATIFSLSSPESYGGVVMEMEEKKTSCTLQEVDGLRQSDGGVDKEVVGGDAACSDDRVRLLEREVATAKAMEMKMLESLIQQTKEMEQAKIALEEAKLEVATLRQQQGRAPAAEPAAAAQWSVMDLMFGGVDEEINGLRAKLRAAVQAEEKSRKAADDLTAALSAVTMEAKQVKAWLSDAQAELEDANAEVDRLRESLHAAEAELWSTTEQLDGLTSDWKEAAVSWRAREKVLLARVRAAEDEAHAAGQENVELAELHRVVDDENGSLRRALERAVDEVNAANESLELATGENSKLQDAVAEKESAMEALRQENESLKASEAEARGRAKELDGQLAAARKAADHGHGAGELAAAADPLSSLHKWRGDMHGKLSAAFLDSNRVMAGRKDRMFASLSNIAELKSAAAAAAMDDFDYEFDHFDGGQYGDLDHAMKQKKRRSILRKFGDFFRRRSLYKRNLAPVIHY
ncbi:interactor of constitutive active ROPs 2, chloroplastic-like [Oryza glaberrima]|uniref:interactor of constitutive active ROPs 2, chloroplastic-like n=1 Tax=Oryza glaberrima TaxID=4538 RepID=UPI00224C259C|nr:interactor of constitutive active ROPs 2, chloroplastic-like [Oryza glaberrima]